MRPVLFAAGCCNLLFAAWVCIRPTQWFTWAGLEPPHYPILWQGLGFLVGIIGLGFLLASAQPIHRWPLVLLGFLGKLPAPLIVTAALAQGALDLNGASLLLALDLLWWVPLLLVLWAAVQAWAGRPPSREKPYTIAEAATHYKLGSGETLLAASRDRTVVLVFLRHFGCTFTRQLLSHLQELEAEARQHDGRLVLVHMLQRGDEKRYLRSSKIDRIADPYCELYRAFGLGKGGLWELFGPTVWIKGFRAFFSGCGAGPIAGDGLQMPGAFLFRDGEILAARPARNAAELPDIHRLFERSAPGH